MIARRPPLGDGCASFRKSLRIIGFASYAFSPDNRPSVSNFEQSEEKQMSRDSIYRTGQIDLRPEEAVLRLHEVGRNRAPPQGSNRAGADAAEERIQNGLIQAQHNRQR